MLELVRRGFKVLTPLGVNQRYDLVVDTGAGFLRIQCKTGRVDKGCVVFNTKSVRSSRTGIFSRCYVGAVDLFAVHCPDTGGIYVVPVDGLPVDEARLRLRPTANNQSRGVRWATDYSLPA